jgi:hypothetical protein
MQPTEDAFMRLAALVVLAAGVGAAMWAQASTESGARSASTPSAAELQSMRHALVDHLRLSEGAITADLLLSPGDAPGDWRFRARAAPPQAEEAAGPGQPHPHGAIYGRAALRCTLDGTRAPLAAGCWKVTLLEVGGARIARPAQTLTED